LPTSQARSLFSTLGQRVQRFKSITKFLKKSLDWKLGGVRGFVRNKLEPVTASASLWFTLEKPKPFDVGDIFGTDASDHSVGVKGVNNVWLLLGPGAPLASLHEERILKK
jgi:hypothetical protein